MEPDDRMREVLQRSVPGIRALSGRGESIPLEDASAAAVFASSSWHWMELVPTLLEVGRVLVPGGVLGVMWSGPDRDAPFFQQAQALLTGDGPSPVGEHGAELSAAVNDPYGNNQILEIPSGVPFDQPETHVVTWDEALTLTTSLVCSARSAGSSSWSPTSASGSSRRLGACLRDALGVEGDVTVDVGYRCEVWRARRHG